MNDMFTDFALEQDNDGIYDLVIDDDIGDLKTISGFETSLPLSIFSDRRARADEVADPMKRRGWDGNLYSDIPEDNFGCGYWLWIEQARLSSRERNNLYHDTIEALQWLIDENMARGVDVDVWYEPAKRNMRMQTKIIAHDGSVVVNAWQVWSNTKPTQIKNN